MQQRKSGIVTKSPPINDKQLELIKHTVAKGASDDELKLFLVIANKTGLDPFTRQIHFVKRGGVGTVQTGIDGYRAIAERSGTLAGIDDAIYDTEDQVHPNKASVTVHRMVDGHRVPFTASARWNEYVPSAGHDFMWRKMPYLMLGKVAEALALRKAFPADLSGLYTDEEMQQQAVDGEAYEMASNTDSQPRLLTMIQGDGPKAPSENQLTTIHKLMDNKGFTEADIMQVGFPKLKELTGGGKGTASKLIDWLIKSKQKQSVDTSS